jgi:hypothetical protein
MKSAEEKLSKINKVLANISIWVLFIIGLLDLGINLDDFFTRSGGDISAGEPYHFSDVAWLTSAVVILFLAVIAMKIRKSLD